MVSVKILLVDDSRTDRMIIQSMLREYQVLSANDGVEAMQTIDENSDIDIMILDLNMPNMDGFQVLEALKSNQANKGIRTIILTNYDEQESEIKGLKLGAVDYIRKPVNMDSLKARIEIHVELLRIQQLLEEKLLKQGLTFDIIFSQAPIGIAISHNSEPYVSNKDVIVQINPAFEQITGRTKAELTTLGWSRITHPDDIDEDTDNFRQLKLGEIKSYSMEKRYIKPDGSIVWVDMVVSTLNIFNDQKYNHICLVQDITKRKILEKGLIESERSKSILLSSLPGMAYRCNNDRNWTMQFVSAGCLELTGYEPASILNNNEIAYNDLIVPEYQEALWKEWERILLIRQPFRFEYEITTAKGKRIWVLEIGQGIYNDKGEVEALEGIIIDISDRKGMEDTLRYNSEHDELTGLFNRRSLEVVLLKDLQNHSKEKRALVSINLSAMHSLSVLYGFQYSLNLVKKIADELKQHCNDRCVLFNAYEYHFVYYIRGYNDKNELADFCEKISNVLSALLMLERINAGIGVLELEDPGKYDVEQLLKNLLITTEEARALGEDHNYICFYNKELENRTIRRGILQHELAQISLDGNEERLFLQYQPILDLKKNEITGYEALARYRSEQLGLVPPLEFIPLVEETKHIISMGASIIRKACAFITKLKSRGHDSVYVSINISAIQLLSKGFVENLLDTITAMKVEPKLIILELTESVFSSKLEQINRILGQLRDHGIMCSIDDFGTGYSSLSRERELNVNCLKIDKSFIDKLMVLRTEETITVDIISMAHKLGHCVVAEGVEYMQQLEYLKTYGCDKVQGYLISRPLDEDKAIELLNTPVSFVGK